MQSIDQFDEYIGLGRINAEERTQLCNPRKDSFNDR